MKIASGLHCSQIQDQSCHSPVAKIVEGLVELRQTVLSETSKTHVAKLGFNELGLKRTVRCRFFVLSFRLQAGAGTKARKKTLDCGLVDFLIGQRTRIDVAGLKLLNHPLEAGLVQLIYQVSKGFAVRGSQRRSDSGVGEAVGVCWPKTNRAEQRTENKRYVRLDIQEIV